MKKLKHLLSFLLLSLAIYLPALGQQVVFSKISPPEGMNWGVNRGIAQDQEGFLWMATPNGLHRYDGYRFVSFYHDPEDKNSLASDRLSTVFVSRSGILWIGTLSDGLDRFDPATKTFTHFTHDPKNPSSLSGKMVLAIIEDRQGVLWVGTNGGLNRFDPGSGTFTRYRHHPQDTTSLSHDHVQALHEDRRGTLWVGTGDPYNPASREGGLNRFHPESGTFTRYLHHPKGANTLLNNKVRAIYEDSRGTFWIGTVGDGLHTMDRKKGTFTRHQYDPRQPAKLSVPPLKRKTSMDDGVTFIHEDVSGAIWVGTAESGASRFDPVTGKVAHFEANSENSGDLQVNSVLCAHNSKDGLLWIGTGEALYRTDPQWPGFDFHAQGAGVYGVFEDVSGRLWVGTSNGLKQYMVGQGESRLIDLKIPLPPSLARERVYVIREDRKGNVWVGGERGLWRWDPNTQAFILYAHNPLVSTSMGEGPVIAILEDRGGILWVGTDRGGLSRMDPETETFSHFLHEEDNPGSLSHNFVAAIHEDRQGNLWVGNWVGGGLNRLDRKSGKFKRYFDRGISVLSIQEDATGRVLAGSDEFGLLVYMPEKDEFVPYKNKRTGNPISASVRGMAQDNQGNLWVSTFAGLLKLDQEGKVAATYGAEMGLNPKEFHVLATQIGRNGHVYVGSNTGFYTYLPQETAVNRHPPQITLSDFRLFDNAVMPGQEPLPLPLNQVKEIVLSHDQNVFAFDFAGIHYTKPDLNEHFFMLENYEDTWRPTRIEHSASYYKVPPGEYVFRVKAASSEGVWAEKALPIIIRPPWWRTWWAYGGYGLLFLTGLLLARRETVRRERIKAGLLLKQVEADKLREVDTLKSRFFSNVSHEFRTPLALIQGTVQKLAGKEQPGDKRLPAYGLIHRSSERLLQLVNQLLDLSRLEAGKLTLQPEPGEVTSFLTLLASSFASLFENKGIRYRYQLPPEPLWVMFEKDKLEKILSNLLSNACKFTSEGGEVVLAVEVERPHPAQAVLHISVRDTGVGIPAELVERVFERFFQADPSATRTHEGAGIGLALTKELVELHGGTISVESSQGQGSTFRIALPLEVAEEPETSWQEEPDEEQRLLLEQQTAFSESVEEKEQQPARKDQPVVLVVEDNPDLRHFVRDCLPAEYAVYEAGDGNAGWEKALEVLPDLIISDVMMPGLDGVSLCQRLKTDERTSHIAVILLTAKADGKSKLAGLETGADDYLTKPFRLEELLLRVHNLLESRERLRQRYSRSLTLQPSEVTVISVDEKFLQKVMAVVEEHLPDPAFDLDVFCREVGMSRVHLHRKLKALTNQSPGELIRTFRLTRAARLLEQQHGNISDVAYAVGFNSLTYFTKCFREHFGQTPSEYAAQYTSAPATRP